MMTRTGNLCIGFALALGCGASQPPNNGQAVPTASSTPPTPPILTPDSGAIARVVLPTDILSPGATMGAHVDFDRVRAAPVFAELLPALKELAAPKLAEFVAKCGHSPLDTLKEVVTTRGPKGTVIALTTSVPIASVFDCVKAFGARQTTIAGHDGLVVDKAVVVEHRGLLVAVAAKSGDDEDGGDAEALLKDVLDSPPSPDLGQRLALLGDTLVTVFDDDGTTVAKREARAIRGSLRANAGEIGLDASFERLEDGDGDVKAYAKMMALMKRPQAADELKMRGADVNAVRQLLDGVHYEATGRARHLSVVVHGDAATVASAIKGLFVAGMQKYVRNAKTAEARNSLGQIAMSMRSYVDSQTTPAASHRFPPSAPRIPASLDSVRGRKWMSRPADWAQPSWRAIKFTIDDPQYYAYEFETSRDGKKVTIRAQGDLDGNGVYSRFELLGEIRNGEAQFAPNIAETNPEE